MSVQIYEPASNDFFATPLRNIRVYVDGSSAVVDLIESVVKNEIISEDDVKNSSEYSEIDIGSRLIVEDNRFMRAHFENIRALIVQEEFIDIAAISYNGRMSALRTSDDKAVHPFLRIINSQFKQKLQEHEGRDDPNLNHFRILSMETHIDILAYLIRTEWLKQ